MLKSASSRINVNKEVSDGCSNGWKDKMVKVAGNKRGMAQL